VVIAVIVFIGISNIGPIIKNAVNTYGPEITDTKVKVDDVSVSLFSGKVKLKNFLLGNPQGFTSEKAIEVEKLKVDIDENTITKDTIVIDKIEIDRPLINYEKKGNTDNFNAILSNIEKKIASKGSKEGGNHSQDEKSQTKEVKLLIRDLILKNGKVSLTMPLLRGKPIEAKLPDIHLTNIGSNGSGVTPEKAMKIIIDALIKNLKSPDITQMIDNNLKKIEKNLKSLGKGNKKGANKIKDKLQSLFRNKK
ncbi:MAG: AsmA family protein, partial [Candidatus Schekmanbacteria bacterium]